MLNAINLVTNTPPSKPRSAPDSDAAGAAPDGFARAIAKARLAEREQNRQMQRAADAADKGPQTRSPPSPDAAPEAQGKTRPDEATAQAERDVAARDRPGAAEPPATAPAVQGKADPSHDAAQEAAESSLTDPVDATGKLARARDAMDADLVQAQGTAAAFAQRSSAAASSFNAAMQRVQSAVDTSQVGAAAAKKSRGAGDEGHTLPLSPLGSNATRSDDDTQGKISTGLLATVSAGNATTGGEGQSSHTRDSTGRRSPSQGLAMELQEGAKAGEGAAALTDAKADEARLKLPGFAQALSAAQSEGGASTNLFGTPVASGTFSTSATTIQPQAQATLSAGLGSEAFGAQASQQIAVFVRDGIHTARLNLNPAEMGPVTVQIQLDGLNAQVHLAAEQGLTRQALEQSMPMLASQLRESGLTLTGGGVFEQPRQTAQDNAQGQSGSNLRDNAQAGNARPPAAGDETRPGAPAAGGRPLQRTRGMVDLVA